MDGRDPRALLLLVASEIEARAVFAGARPGQDPELPASWACASLVPGIDWVVTGVGKSNAAGAAAAVLARREHRGTIVVGIAGVLPGGGMELGEAASLGAAVLADEGVQTPDGFVDVASLGFPPVPGHGVAIPASGEIADALGRAIGRTAVVATVSTCSGTDAHAAAVAERTGAGLEDMETGAAAAVCVRLGVPWGGVRVVSNTTGERSRQRWEMAGALRGLSGVIGAVVEAVRRDAL